PHHSGAELAKHFAEVHGRVLDDPVEFTPWTGDETVEAGGYAIVKLAHGSLYIAIYDTHQITRIL
ncbi:MAG: hypothetical protein WA354_07910, partial [Terracidiphilus sp.]